jgi:hypothetical protein
LRKDGTCAGKLILKNPRITLGFHLVESQSKNGGKGKMKLKGGKLTKLKQFLRKWKLRPRGQRPSPHVHIFWHALEPNFALAITRGGKVEEESKGNMGIEEPQSKDKVFASTCIQRKYST